MAARRRVVEQHEDWLNLTDAEAPWFSLPALKRALSNGLDPTPPEVRAEHRARWYGDDDSSNRPGWPTTAATTSIGSCETCSTGEATT